VTDQDVAFLLRSDLALATIEAPAGCGKTFQGANYALDAASSLAAGRVLILTHTHAARSVFANRTRKLLDRVEIRTLDSFLTEIAAIYHRTLDLPLDVGSWARENSAYDVVAAKCRQLLEYSGNVARAAALRYPIIICDEHQDASADQHAAIMAINRAGSRVRLLGDPMQIIYGGAGTKTSAAIKRWEALKNEGGWGNLANPHRWRSGSLELGEWVLAAREALASDKTIDLAGTLPAGLTVLHAANSALVAHKAITMTADDRRQVSEIARKSSQLFVLTVGNERVNHLNAFFNRSVRIWEGHGREALSTLVKSIEDNPRSASGMAEALLTFVEETCTGFSASLHGRRLRQEIQDGCRKPARGMPAHLQAIGRVILDEPDHRGISRSLTLLRAHITSKTPGFTKATIDLKSEFQDAVKLGGYPSATEGLIEISRRRTFSHPQPPTKCISTVHKAKGLECDNALVMMCDKQSFADTDYKRRLLYVGLSRAMKNLTLVICRDKPSPLFTC
jgi:DNA helicase-2/ATP-dependent DNA helicase PcrA